MNKQKSGAQNSPELKGVSFVVDQRGKKKAVVIDLSLHRKALEELLEDLYGHQKIKERRGERKLSKAEFLKGLKDDGLL